MEEELFECEKCSANVKLMREHRELLAAKVNDQSFEIITLRAEVERLRKLVPNNDPLLAKVAYSIREKLGVSVWDARLMAEIALDETRIVIAATKKENLR